MGHVALVGVSHGFGIPGEMLISLMVAGITIDATTPAGEKKINAMEPFMPNYGTYANTHIQVRSTSYSEPPVWELRTLIIQRFIDWVVMHIVRRKLRVVVRTKKMCSVYGYGCIQCRGLRRITVLY